MAYPHSTQVSRAWGRTIARPAVFLDRDGVIIENQEDYIKSWDKVHFLPEVFEMLRRLARSKYALVLVTNQSVVGRGIITLDQAERINSSIVRKIESKGGRIDASYFCPHHPDDKCNCRKPAPGMFLSAAQTLNLDLKSSFVIGDAVSDLKAARIVGAQGILVLTGRGKEQVSFLDACNKQEWQVVADLNEAVDFIISKEETD